MSVMAAFVHCLEVVSLHLLLTLPLTRCQPSNTVWYVSSSGDNSDGSSWSKAYTDIQDALDECASGESVYIKEGTYYPTTGSDRTSTFSVPEGCRVYGGFSGTESSFNSRTGSDTILDGNIGDSSDATDNVYHVVTLSTDVRLNGLTIRNGYGVDTDDETDYSINSGGGAFLKSDSSTFDLTNVVFEDNVATQGGALFVIGSTNKGSTMTGCNFTNNEAIDGTFRGGYGGAVFLSYNADTTIDSCIFDGNVAVRRGGALYEDYGTDIDIYDSEFTNNEVTNGHGGAIFVEDRNSQYGTTALTIHNSNIEGNQASGYGGGIMLFNLASGNFTNIAVKSNTAAIDGGIGSFDGDWDASSRCTSCTFTSNTATDDSSTNNYGIQETVSATNVSFNVYSETTYLTSLWDTYQSVTLSVSDKAASSRIIYVDENVGVSPSNRDGTTWTKAYSDLQDAIDDLCSDATPSDVEIWVAAGEYSPTDVPSWSPTSSPKDKSFILCDDTTIFGGFDGSETNRDDRDWKTNPTYFSSTVGATGGSSAQQIVIAGDNSRIDGMIFKRGYNTVSGARRRERRRLTGETSLSDVISDTSRLRGAGLFANATNIDIVNCLFIENFGYKGGGAYCMGYKGSDDYRYPSFYNVAFVGNGGYLRGGAIAADAYCNFYCEYCNFVGNAANEKGGAIYLDFSSSPTFYLSTFDSNSALEAGGAIALDGGGSMNVANCTATDNSAVWEGGAYYTGSFNIDSENQSISLIGNSISGSTCDDCHADYFVWGPGGIYINSYVYTGSGSSSSSSSSSGTSTSSSSSSTSSSSSSSSTSSSSSSSSTSSANITEVSLMAVMIILACLTSLFV